MESKIMKDLNKMNYNCGLCNKNPMKSVDGFRGDYFFLSNFYECSVEYNGLMFRNSEAAFQAQKCPERAEEFTQLTGADAKKLGREVKLVDNWDMLKVKVMTEVLYAKFASPELMDKLANTYPAALNECNDWGDNFWGKVKVNDEWVGENHLGRILESIRDIKESYLYDMCARLRKDDTHSYVIRMKVVAKNEEDAHNKVEFYINSGNSGYVFNYIEKVWLEGSRQLIPV